MMNKRLGLLLEAASLLAAAGIVLYSVKRNATGHGRRTASAPVTAPPDIVEEASLQSFPASDPPSWTSTALL